MSYAIYIGRDHTPDGIAWLAGYGDEPSSHWLEVVPRGTYDSGASVEVGVGGDADMPGHRTHMPVSGDIARHLRVSYSYFRGVPAPITNGGLNEHGVAVRDIWSPSRPDLVAMTPKDQTGPNYSDLARLVLERARTAREGVEVIADLIDKHGYSTYGGNCHMIADPDEAWLIIEFAGGRKLWVAEKLGPSDIRAARPGYMGKITDTTGENFLYPSHFFDTAIEQGWYDPAQGPFDVDAIYGEGKGPYPAVAWIEGEMRARAARPEKIQREDVFWAISTERLTGDAAGYGQAVPLVHPSHDALRMMWHAAVGPLAAPLTPVFLGMTGVPDEYAQHRYLTQGEAHRFLDLRKEKENPDTVSHVEQGIEVADSAVYQFKRLMHLVFQDNSLMGEVSDHWRRMEADLADDLPNALRSAELLLEADEPDLAARLLTNESHRWLNIGLEDCNAIVSSAHIRLRRAGRLNRTKRPHTPEQL